MVNQKQLLQLTSSWWWAWGCLKHVKLYLINLRDWCIWLVDLFEHKNIFLKFQKFYTLILNIFWMNVFKLCLPDNSHRTSVTRCICACRVINIFCKQKIFIVYKMDVSVMYYKYITVALM
jgi:hypothetical protein